MKRSVLSVLWAVAPVVIMAAAQLISCGHDSPTDSPKLQPEPLKDYPVWFGEDTSPMIYRYWPVARKFDSIPFPYHARVGLTVSADGKRLYAASLGRVTVVDTATMSIVAARLPYQAKWPVVVSPDNQLLAIQGDGLHILRTSDYSVVFSDTGRTALGSFSSDSKSFYCTAGVEHGGYVYKVTLSDSSYPVTRKRFSQGIVIQVIPSPDETKWYLYKKFGPYAVYGFEVYDVLRDSILFSYKHTPGAAVVTMAPDGKRLYFGNPGTLHMFAFPSASFNTFDVATNKLLDSVLTSEFSGDSLFNDGFFFPGRMSVTPDGRWLVILDALHQQILTYDLVKQEFVDFQSVRRIGLYPPTVQLIK